MATMRVLITGAGRLRFQAGAIGSTLVKGMKDRTDTHHPGDR